MNFSSRHKNRRNGESDEAELLVFGYSSRIYANDTKSELMGGENHLQPWTLDDSVMIDRSYSFIHPSTSTSNTRFDCRLLLSIIPSEIKGVLTKEEEKIERGCEDERWKDLHDAELAALKRVHEEEIRPKKAEFAFSYESTEGSSSMSPSIVDDGSDSEDEPFIPPSGIKLPMGLQTPDNQKINHVIEKTALFVVKQGPQMEIVIKAKQRNNTEQFGFLHFDNVLNPYYKYIMKLIREGKYTPSIEKKKKNEDIQDKSIPTGKENGMGGGTGGRNGMGKKPGALDALIAQHEFDSDSDSDCELHPSLLAGSRRGGSPDPVDKGHKSFSGPQRRPLTPPPTIIRKDYSIETANDSYSTLSKNLAQIKDKKEKETVVVVDVPANEDEVSEETKKEWLDFSQWFESFYSMPPPIPFASLPYIPPPPDLEKVLSSYARYVAENGAEAEFALKGRVELQLHFLTPSNPHHLYYLSAVRRAQWERNQDHIKEKNAVDEAAMREAAQAPPPPLNRKQRRSAFMDAPQVSIASSPTVLDPSTIGLASFDHHLTRSASSPLMLSTVPERPSMISTHPISPAPLPPIPPPPPPHHSSSSSTLSSLNLQPCPVPPSISSLHMSVGGSQIGSSTNPSTSLATCDIMTERQLKARLFMEKILNDKRKKKEEEEGGGGEKCEEIRSIEDGEIEDDDKNEEKKGDKDRDRRRDDKKEKKKDISTDFIDTLIKSKMDKLLKETVPGSLAVEKKNEEIKEKKRREEEDDERRRRREDKDKDRKSRKKKRKRRSSSRSRSSSEERRRRRRRRSRSRSSDIPSKYRHR